MLFVRCPAEVYAVHNFPIDFEFSPMQGSCLPLIYARYSTHKLATEAEAQN